MPELCVFYSIFLARYSSAPRLLPILLCRQLGLGDDRIRWVPKELSGFTIIHPDRTLRRNRKPVLKAVLLQEEAGRSSRARS